MGWNDAKKAAEESGGGNYIKFKDGDKKQIVVVGEPVHFFQIYGPKGGQKFDRKVPGSSFRFKVSIVEINGPTFEPKILELGRMVFDRLVYLAEEMGIENKILIVHRKGSTKDDTTYNIDIKGPLSTEQIEVIKEMSFPKLSIEKNDDIPDDIPPFPEDNDAPF